MYLIYNKNHDSSGEKKKINSNKGKAVGANAGCED